jgi:hypothetical protein
MPDIIKRKPFKLGRLRPRARGPRLFLKNYLLRTFPSGPSVFDYSGPAAQSLNDVYLNDIEGCCVISAMAHITGVFTANACGAPLMFKSADLNRLYSAIGGYVPGDETTDNGCDELTALNYWAQFGLFPDSSHRSVGYISVNPLDIIELRTANWLFENLFLGMELPDEWISPFPNTSGFIWDIAGEPNPDNGHAVAAVGCSKDGIIISSWGLLGTLTFAAARKYLLPPTGELYAVLSNDIINKAMKKAPNGFDWTQLLADFQAIGGITHETNSSSGTSTPDPGTGTTSSAA